MISLIILFTYFITFTCIYSINHNSTLFVKKNFKHKIDKIGDQYILKIERTFLGISFFTKIYKKFKFQEKKYYIKERKFNNETEIKKFLSYFENKI